MTVTQLRQLKRKLPPEIRKNMAERLNFSYSYINMVLMGTRNNPDIVKLAIREAEKLSRRKTIYKSFKSKK